MSEVDNASGTPETPVETLRTSSLADQLTYQLDELKKKQADMAAEQVDTNIADLEKLIADAGAVHANYAEVHQALKDREEQLIDESKTLTNALTAALGAERIVSIKSIVTEHIKVVNDAKENLRITAQKAADDARDKAAEMAKALENAKAKLDTWRKPGTNIDKRLKLAEGLITEIKKLRNGPHRGEAYWKLALGGHGDVPGQEFLNILLDPEAHPKVIAPDELEKRILEAWTEFHDLRTEAAKSKALLAAAEQTLKDAQADYADKSKNLIKAIAEALAAREAASDAT